MVGVPQAYSAKRKKTGALPFSEAQHNPRVRAQKARAVREAEEWIEQVKARKAAR